MAKIIPLRSDPHRDTQADLPWYVTGQLDESERARVDEHLATCASCREDLESERLLANDIAKLPLNADAGWAELRRRMNSTPRQRRLQGQPIRTSRTLPRAGRIGWLIAAQAVVLAAFAYTLAPGPSTETYHTLSSSETGEAANVIVIFRPDVTEAQLRATLTENRAQIVDGPTASGTFALRVPAEERGAIVASLQKDETIALAQPIDGGSGG